jgi:hypothetical protein
MVMVKYNRHAGINAFKEMSTKTNRKYKKLTHKREREPSFPPVRQTFALALLKTLSLLIHPLPYPK